MSIKKHTIIIGLILLVLALLFPPYIYVANRELVKGHAFIFADTAEFINGYIVTASNLDVPAFIIQIVVAFLLTVLSNFVPIDRGIVFVKAKYREANSH